MLWRLVIAVAYTGFVGAYFAHRANIRRPMSSIVTGVAALTAGYWALYYYWLAFTDFTLQTAVTGSRWGHTANIGLFALMTYSILRAEQARRQRDAVDRRLLKRLLDLERKEREALTRLAEQEIE